ncbi:MAG: hypothetical protein WBP16_06230 [Ferruginibacter sp.]
MYRYIKYKSFISMTRPRYKAKSDHVIVQAIKNFIGKIRQNPDIYPIRYYKKNRKFRNTYNGPAVK